MHTMPPEIWAQEFFIEVWAAGVERPAFKTSVNPTGVRTQASRTNLFHGDVLLSYQPIPGTVILAGYGSDMTDERAFGFRDLTRARDAFFAKVSWLFRM